MVVEYAQEINAMTRYLLSMYQPDGDPPPPEVLDKVMEQLEKVNDEIKAAGAWLFSGGLTAPGSATVVRGNGSAALISDGPFVEAKEHVGGFWIVEADDLDTVLNWSKKIVAATTLPVEVRPFQG